MLYPVYCSQATRLTPSPIASAIDDWGSNYLMLVNRASMSLIGEVTGVPRLPVNRQQHRARSALTGHVAVLCPELCAVRRRGEIFGSSSVHNTEDSGRSLRASLQAQARALALHTPTAVNSARIAPSCKNGMRGGVPYLELLPAYHKGAWRLLLAGRARLPLKPHPLEQLPADHHPQEGFKQPAGSAALRI